jgi:uncharacterized secreted protein with C-terminal beta-propeller domain
MAERARLEAAAVAKVEKDLPTALKILEQVKEVGIDAWSEAIMVIASNGGWPSYLTSLVEDQKAWDQETKEE